jgi:hypothetical protein
VAPVAVAEVFTEDLHVPADAQQQGNRHVYLSALLLTGAPYTPSGLPRALTNCNNPNLAQASAPRIDRCLEKSNSSHCHVQQLFCTAAGACSRPMLLLGNIQNHIRASNPC